MHLTNAEEQLMKILWKLHKGYLKDIREQYEDPKPAPTTIATLLKRMTQKEIIGYHQHGNNRQYFPIIKKSDYFSKYLNDLIRESFNNSIAQFTTFFISEINFSEKELKELKKIVEMKLANKKSRA